MASYRAQGFTSYREVVKAEVHKKYCDVRELIDHVISESTEAYRGTARENDFFIYHDARKQFWEVGAKEYIRIKYPEMERRILRITGEFAFFVKRYKDSVVGDSPEMARALDSYGFADLELSMLFHVSLTSVYPDNDPRKFKMNTPSEVWRTMTRCWEVEPTSERVIADIEDWPRVLRAIRDAEGTIVFGEALRSGNRWQRSDGKGELKSKFRSRQRKSTLHGRPVHPDGQEAFDRLTQPRIDALRAVVHTGTAVENTIALRQEITMEIQDYSD